jgi:hypothetical protein
MYLRSRANVYSINELPEAGIFSDQSGLVVSEILMQDAGCKMQDAGCKMQDARYLMPDAGCRHVGKPEGERKKKSSQLRGFGNAMYVKD